MNHRHKDFQSSALPLSYSGFWGRLDSNQRRNYSIDLQSIAFNHSATASSLILHPTGFEPITVNLEGCCSSFELRVLFIFKISPGWIWTNDLMVNSHPLYHWATREFRDSAIRTHDLLFPKQMRYHCAISRYLFLLIEEINFNSRLFAFKSKNINFQIKENICLEFGVSKHSNK